MDSDSWRASREQSARWRPRGAATAQGSFPGRGPQEPVRIMAGETPDLPCVPELPGRGPGADMVGRALGMLSMVSPDFAAETGTTGWRLAGRTTDGATRAMTRARSWLAEDLDAAEEGYRGTAAVKLAMAGPWTIAAAVDLSGGHRMLRDPGALRDLTAAFIEAAVRQVVELRRRFPTAALVLQIDEPSLPAVLAGGIPTVSGLDRYRGVSGETARSVLAAVIRRAHEEGAAVVLHCCAVPAPIDLLRQTGADALSLDLSTRRRGLASDEPGGVANQEEELGQLLESDCGLVAGVVDPDAHTSTTASVSNLLALLSRLGIAADDVLARLAVSTPCGLAGESPDGAKMAVKRIAEVSSVLRREVS